MTVYCFDIDGTICANTDGDYEHATLFKEVVGKINRLYDSGHKIIFYTARGSTTGIDWYDVTRLGSLRATLLSATTETTALVSVILQQLRRY